MSVLIKGMEMPTNDKMLFLRIYPNGKVTIDMDLECKQIATAVSVPPHGRLIDADRFYDDNSYFADKDFIDSKYGDTLMDLINNAPTIIPAKKKKNGMSR